jgi:hypothetical protein
MFKKIIATLADFIKINEYSKYDNRYKKVEQKSIEIDNMKAEYYCFFGDYSDHTISYEFKIYMEKYDYFFCFNISLSGEKKMEYTKIVELVINSLKIELDENINSCYAKARFWVLIQSS